MARPGLAAHSRIAGCPTRLGRAAACGRVVATVSSTAERERPAEAGELAGDGDVGALPPRPQVEVPAVQPAVRPRGDPRR
ncbi:MAG: hypothetical protein IJ092_06040, partial [Atopobiaceae bacterium]|nr:hypothetical protein [Atopobiaceae bacterium]